MRAFINTSSDQSQFINTCLDQAKPLLAKFPTNQIFYKHKIPTNQSCLATLLIENNGRPYLPPSGIHSNAIVKISSRQQAAGFGSLVVLEPSTARRLLRAAGGALETPAGETGYFLHYDIRFNRVKTSP